jgi:hypothetical protein
MPVGVNRTQVEAVNDSVGVRRDRLLEIALRFVPARLVEHLAAKEAFGDQP